MEKTPTKHYLFTREAAGITDEEGDGGGFLLTDGEGDGDTFFLFLACLNNIEIRNPSGEEFLFV